MDILIVGTGYVGLVTGACFAEMGHRVTCLDTNSSKILSLRDGKIPFFEPGLEDLVRKGVAAGRLLFTTDYGEAVKKSTICFIAVATPSFDDGSCNLDSVYSAIQSIAEIMSEDKIIVIKSTVSVGSAQKIKEKMQTLLANRGVDLHCDVVSNPEFLKEGSAVSDCMKPDRIIIGVQNPTSLKLMRELYAPFSLNHDRILVMDHASAEMAKYAANAMLATRISFMNELAGLCEKLGANINEVRIGIGSDQRIGYHFLYAGAGFGGSCFPKDLKALKAMGKNVGYEMKLIDAVESINERQKQLLSDKMLSYFSTQSGGLKGKTIAVWGLSFKPDTDDLREAPSLSLIKALRSEGASLRLFDPVALSSIKKELGDPSEIYYASDEYDAAKNADAIALMTEWKQFRFVDFKKIQTSMKQCVFFDGRNQYKKDEMHRKGFKYFSIGVP